MTQPQAPTSEPAVVITATIYPVKDGKRKIVVSGAQEGEMPAVCSGVFSELHDLVNAVWLTLQTRKPQVVRRASDKAGTAPEASGDATPDDAAEIDASAELAAPPSGEKPAGEPETPDDLPGIQKEQETSE